MSILPKFSALAKSKFTLRGSVTCTKLAGVRGESNWSVARLFS